MGKYKELLAHYDKDCPGKKQLLLEHLLNVAIKSKDLGAEIKLESASELIGLLHDFGKWEDKFQSYIRGEYAGRVDHSSAGGIIVEYIANQVYKKYNIKDLLESEGIKEGVWNLYGEILQYPILAHHGLYDIIDNNLEYRTGIRLNPKKEDKENFIKRNLEFLNLLNAEYINLSNKSIYDLYHKGFKEFTKVYEILMAIAPRARSTSGRDERIRRRKTLDFYYGALTRLLLSILKDADIYDSSNYYREDKDKAYSQDELNNIWVEMGQSIEDLYEGFGKKENKSELDFIRTKMANEAYDFSRKYDKGAYKLDMPVGSGKTFTSLRYSIGNAEKFNKKRVFYCTAFLSVLEQNATSIKEVLGDKYILEHHSNIIQDCEGSEEEQDKREYEVSEYLKESWESPIILTTLVQLTNTMFKHRASNIRRFSKLINSVIIIDEIQSLPTKAIYNFNLMTNFLTNIMGCIIVHSTATPPGLDNNEALDYPCNYGSESGNTSIIKPMEEIDTFARVDYYSLLGEGVDTSLNNEELVEHIKNQLEEEKSALVVLNTKKAVGNLYEVLKEDVKLQEENVELIYLTTNQCPNHRLEIIANMKKRLKDLRSSLDKRKIICVSTKLVEAGVDIDFDIAYRSLAGIDSIIQVGGRCNREGKKLSKGKLFIFEYEDENLNYLPDIKKQISATKTALVILSKDGLIDGKIDIEKARDYYFRKLYLNAKNEGNHLEYMLVNNNDTILNLLTSNPKMKGNYEVNTGERIHFQLRQSFKTAAMEFDLIKENTIAVIVPYKNENAINRLYEAIESNNYYDIKIELQRLQPYTINIRDVKEYESYITRELDGEILILSKEAYDHKVGLIKGELQTLYC